MKFNFISWEAVLQSCFRLVVLMLWLALPCCAQAGSSPIEDNSFLVEEAYNQEYGVVQHINTFTRFADSNDWVYTLTEEWPAPGQRHQLSYTLARQHAGAMPRSGSGIGDVLFNYRYQMIGSGETRMAFSPRLTMIFPAGDATLARGSGGFGLQTNLPVSLALAPRLVTHWNAGATFIPRAQDIAGDHALAAGYNLGQSFVWLVHPRVNLMLETVYAANQLVIGRDRTAWARSMYVSPSVRWAYNFKNGLQIVPGVGVPLGVSVSQGEKAVLLYLSFEHPFRRTVND